jgi:hypothetical protein
VVDERGAPIDDVRIGLSCSERDIGSDRNQAHRMSPSGEHTITIKKDGYEELKLKMEAWDFDGTFKKVVLKKKS